MGIIQDMLEDILEECDRCNGFIEEIKKYCKRGNIFYNIGDDILIYVKANGLEKHSRLVGSYDRKFRPDVWDALKCIEIDGFPDSNEINKDIFVDKRFQRHDLPFDKLIEFGAIEAIK